MKESVIYRGLLFEVRSEIVGRIESGRVELTMGAVARPRRRRSWTDEAAREAIPWLASHPDVTAAGPDGTAAVLERVTRELNLTLHTERVL